ncbi:galactokinase-like isoform X1 [Mytilus edulis]|uniref:galactokinase-like isoform X1 n=1 Tax=Mytilus edulis TaxID=6550 RepID=UPI0039F0ADBB
MACRIPDISELLQTAKERFKFDFESLPNKASCAPGRVNLIGEHTDYNEGYVLPMALQMVTIAVGKATDSGLCRVLTLADVGEDNYVEFPLPSEDNPLVPGQLHWANYVTGVVAHYVGSIVSFDAVIISSVPFGGGVSSSASLQVATYTLLDELNNVKGDKVSKEDKARRCMEAEHEFIGLMDGIMDQFISLTAKQDHALLLDCRSLRNKHIPMLDDSVVVLLINSNVSHELIHTEYPKRTRQCKEAAAILGVNSLRDLTLKTLEDRRDLLDNVLYKRTHHVVTEIKRTTEAAGALQNNDFVAFGRLMVDSHISLRDEYEVSCDELDELVEAALEMDGVYGSRMTGGGFGGCTVSLVKRCNVESIIQHVEAKYSKSATFYVCKPSDGARGIEV